MIASFQEVPKTNLLNFVQGTQRLKGSDIIRFAKTMKYDACAEELQKLYLEDQEGETTNGSNLLITLLSFDKSYGIDLNVFTRSANLIVRNSYDINSKNVQGRTMLHEAVIMDTKLEKMAALFEFGYDINVGDKFGITPFVMLCNKARNVDFASLHKPAGNFVTLVKLFIFENPSVICTQKVTNQIFNYDFRLYRIASSSDMTDQSLDNLRLVPLLHAHGYDFSHCKEGPSPDGNTYVPGIGKMIIFPHCFSDALFIIQRTPRTLKEICRVVLRQHYTGRNIRKFVSIVKIPDCITDYILLKDKITLPTYVL